MYSGAEVSRGIARKTEGKTAEDAEVAELADKIAEETTSEIVDVRGRTFTIYRQKKARKAAPKPTRSAASA